MNFQNISEFYPDSLFIFCLNQKQKNTLQKFQNMITVYSISLHVDQFFIIIQKITFFIFQANQYFIFEFCIFLLVVIHHVNKDIKLQTHNDVSIPKERCKRNLNEVFSRKNKFWQKHHSISNLSYICLRRELW